MGTEFLVNSFIPHDQASPAVATHTNGDFVVVWTDRGGHDGAGDGVFGRRFSSGGTPLGAQFQINSYWTSHQSNPAVATNGHGDFVVVWESSGQDGSGSGVFGQRFDSKGNPVGVEFQINSYWTSVQGLPTVATNTGRDFVVTWESDQQDGDSLGVFARQLGVVPSVSCPAVVEGGCTDGFGKSRLLVRDVPGKEKLLAKWGKGPALTQTDMGNPLGIDGTIYTLCVYDHVGNLAGQVMVDRAGLDCQGKPCWKAIGKEPPDPNGKGYKYKDKDGTADGIQKIIFKSSNSAKVVVKGRGASLPAGIPAALQSSASVTVQLHASDGICLSATLTDIKKQAADFFKAK